MLLSLSHVWLFATQWSTTHQVPLFMGFSWEEYRSSFLFPSLGIFLVQGSNLSLLQLLHWGWILYHLNHWGSPSFKNKSTIFKKISPFKRWNFTLFPLSGTCRNDVISFLILGYKKAVASILDTKKSFT